MLMVLLGARLQACPPPWSDRRPALDRRVLSFPEVEQGLERPNLIRCPSRRHLRLPHPPCRRRLLLPRQPRQLPHPRARSLSAVPGSQTAILSAPACQRRGRLGTATPPAREPARSRRVTGSGSCSIAAINPSCTVCQPLFGSPGPALNLEQMRGSLELAGHSGSQRSAQSAQLITHTECPSGHSQEFPLEVIQLADLNASDLGVVRVCAEDVALRFRASGDTRDQETVHRQRR